MKRYKAIAVGILLAFAVCILLLSKQKTASGTGRYEPLKVTMLKVGKADAIVVQAKDSTMVIDTGEEDDGEELTAFLQNQGIARVDTLIITHFDQDHVGGADTLAESMDIGQVLLPAYQGSGTEYTDFMEALNKKGIVPKQLTEPTEWMLGEAVVLVEPPLSYEAAGSTAEIDNNFSLITTVTHGENRLLFTGDAEKQRLREWMSGGTAAGCSFLKVPHHGIYNTVLKELVETTAPQYAVICASDKNPADARTLELLKQHGVQTFQTKDGNVTVISDGNSLELHQDAEH